MVAVLGIFVLITSVFSWLPAMAEDATPESGGNPALTQSLDTDESTPQQTEEQGTTTDEGTGGPQVQADQTDDTGTENQEGPTPPVSIQGIDIACYTDPGFINATVSFANPRSDASVDLHVMADTASGPVATDEQDNSFTRLPLTEATTSLTVQLPLKPGIRDLAPTVSVKALITGDESTAVLSDEHLGVYTENGATRCGTPPSAPGPSQEEPEPGGATGTVPATATATATATVAATATAPDTRYATVVNTGGANLRCRTAPVDGAQITLLPAGSRVELRGDASNGWYPVRCAGQDGYASGDYLRAESSTTSEPPAGEQEAGTATVRNTGGLGLRCRTAPVDGAIIVVLPDGTKLPTRGATQSGWVPVTCSDTAGWVSAQYVSVTGGDSTAPPAGASGGTGTFGTVVNTGGLGLRCRTEPVDGAIIVVLPEGTKLETRGAASNGWYPVTCNGQAGYVSGDYFTLSGEGSTTPPPVSGGARTAMVSGTGGGGLRCRTAPVDGGIITVMPEGAQVEVRGNVSNGWAPVKCAGQDGWSSAAYLLFDIGAGSGELWFDVNLSTQYMRVFRGDTVIMQTYVSTGRPGFDTPTGTFYINRKLTSQTMSGVLGGESYYVPNVPWVMYFTNRGHAIHGAYWHNNFGHVMSHGCINLPVATAEWLYSITPIGTRVRIHY